LPSRKALQIQGDIKNFEDRIKEYWIPEATKHNLTITPDLIIWSSGTWDVLGLRQKYCSHTQSWMEQAVSWQELTWHRQRMHQMIRYGTPRAVSQVFLDMLTFLFIPILSLKASFGHNGPILQLYTDHQHIHTRRAFPLLMNS
jgi:hypothetical protein